MRTIAPEGEPRIFPCGIGDCQFIGQTPQGLGAHRRHTHPKGEIKIQRDDGLTLTPDEADWLELYLNTWELPSVALADMTDDDLMAIGLLRRLRAR
ncbi:MAG TPA: hypothetical protein VFQ40_04805 [Actinomycetota bacterium]|nr:hypothetical protein [Actinomycetota bacterium]